MSEENRAAEPKGALPPLSAQDLPEGFGATWRLVPTGVRWTFFEVLRSRCLLIILMAFLVSIPLILFIFSSQAGSVWELIGSFLGWFASLAFEDEYALAQITGIVILFLSPMILLHGVPCVLVLKLVYNRRECRTEPIPRAKEVHAYDARFKWNVFFASIVGILCFMLLDLAVVSIYCLLLVVFECLGILPDGSSVSDTTRILLSYVALMLTELPNRWLAGRGDSNALQIERLALGGYDAWLPERLCTPEGRALVARLMGVGAANTVQGAVLLTRVLDVCAAAKDVSDVLGELLDVFLTIVTFGGFGLVTNAAEDVSSVCAENAARGVAFGEEGFLWPQPDPGELRRRSLRTIAFAAGLLLCIVCMQPLVVAT